jgi:phosphotransferase system  glucose/maltose/N-acetylglucosamine-specific IIC component
MRKNIIVTFLMLIALGSISYMLWIHISIIVNAQDGTKKYKE